MTQPTDQNDTITEPAGDPPAEQPTTEPKPAEQLGDAGKKALQAERDARKKLEKQLAELSPLTELLQRIRGGEGVPESQKTDVDKLTERIEAAEKLANDERTLRLRLEVATEKGLTPAQAQRLTGSTREELAADADALLELFPTRQPGTPKPDPSQGQRGPVDIDAQIRDAESKGDVRTAIRLKSQKLLNTK